MVGEQPVVPVEVESVTPLDPQSGSPLTTATTKLVERLDARMAEVQRRLEKGFRSGQTAFGLPVAILNTAIDAARLTLKATGSIAKATAAAIDWVRKNHPDLKFDADKFRDHIYINVAEPEPAPKLPPKTAAAQAPGAPVQVADSSTSKLTQFVKENLTANRGLPQVVFDKWLERQGKVNEQKNRVAHGIREFYRALQKEYGIGFFRKAVRGLSDVPTEAVRNMNQFLQGKAPLESVPEGVRASLSELRNHIDLLSNQLIRDGLINDRLALVVDKNLGAYLNRSYRVFDDPKWGLSKLTPENQNRVVSGMLADLRAK